MEVKLLRGESHGARLRCMDESELAEMLLRDHLLAAAALTALQLRQLPEFARLRLADAVMHGTGYVECARESMTVRSNSSWSRQMELSRYG